MIAYPHPVNISRDIGELRKLLLTAKRIAVVGASPRPDRDSYKIFEYLLSMGYEAIPVNPAQDAILGQKCYPDVKSIPGEIDIVDVFRNPEHMPEVVADAIAAKAKSVWMQLDTGNRDAATLAVDAGLDVVYELCIRTVHSTMRIPKK